MKKKYSKTNHTNFRTKELEKSLMAGPKLRGKFLRDRKEQSKSGNGNKTKILHNTFTEGEIEAL